MHFIHPRLPKRSFWAFIFKTMFYYMRMDSRSPSPIFRSSADTSLIKNPLAYFLPSPKKWCVTFGNMGVMWEFCTKRKTVRRFATLQSAANFLSDLGIKEFRVRL
jgi:hypothetical protein